jgi:hypothetical protein
MSFPDQNKGKKVSMSVLLQTLFKMQPSNMLAHLFYVVNLSPLYFRLWGHLKTLVYSGPIVNVETLDQCIFMPFKSFASLPGHLKEWDSP